MIRPRDRATAARFNHLLQQFSANDTPLPGIASAVRRATYVAQLIESMRRVEFVDMIRRNPVSHRCADPRDVSFNPLKAAVYHVQQGMRDEAFWLVFLLTHFSKHNRQGWALTRAIYGKLGAAPFWSWSEISTNPADFRPWLRRNQAQLQGLSFGNHRKYESLREDSARGLASVIESYVNWIGPPRTHDDKVQSIIGGINDPHRAFDELYRDASALFRWGRLAKFDHLTMLAKVGLLNIHPGTAYLSGATGPRRGAALLLHDNAAFAVDIAAAESVLARLGDQLGVGQQEIEDSICNWQKSPDKFVPFR